MKKPAEKTLGVSLPRLPPQTGTVLGSLAERKRDRINTDRTRLQGFKSWLSCSFLNDLRLVI